MEELVGKRVKHREFGEGTIIQQSAFYQCDDDDGLGEILVLFDERSPYLHSADFGTKPEVLLMYSAEERDERCWFFLGDFQEVKLIQ